MCAAPAGKKLPAERLIRQGHLSLIRSHEPRFLGRRAQARGDELLVLVGREVTDPRGVGCLVGVDLLRERVAPLGDDGAHVCGEHPHVCDQRRRREDEHRPGVVGAAVGEHRIVHEVRERQHDSRPQRERVRPVLDPRASPELHERRDRARGQQRHARVPRPVRQAVVHVGEVPQVVGDDPPDRQVAPDEGALLALGDEDPDPPGDCEQVQDARNAVHDVPRPAPRDHPLRGIHPVNPVALEVAHHGLGDVDREDRGRDDQVPAVVAQPREDLQGDEAQGPRQRRVLFDDREPARRSRPRRRVRPPEDGQSDRHEDEECEDHPHVALSQPRGAREEGDDEEEHRVVPPLADLHLKL